MIINRAFALSKQIVLCFLVAICLTIVFPTAIQALSFLGGFDEEALINMLGIADSSLLVSRGTDTLMVLSTSYEAPESNNLTFLGTLLGIIIAVGISVSVYKVSLPKQKRFKNMPVKDQAYLVATTAIVGIFTFIVAEKLLDVVF